MITITIIGFGRFGKTLYKLLKDDFAITIFTRSEITDTSNFTKQTKIAKNLADAYKNDIIFFCVPIASFENVIKKHKKYFRDFHTLIDVLSVKMHPKKIFEQQIKNKHIQILLTHPMFGPDSSKFGFEGLPIILDKFQTNNATYNFWKSFFEKKKLKIVEMTAQEHDKLAARSQGVAHFIGRLLEEYKMKPTLIDSVGAKKLLEVMEQTCNDTWELFSNLQTFNPYTKAMRLQIGKAYNKLYNKLLPKRVNKNCVIFGIQGGIGSFNEEALLHYFANHNVGKYKVNYLFTTKNVLEELHKGNIDFGLFAIVNSTGGLVEETVRQLGKYKFSIVEDFTILIRHFLMKRKDIRVQEIKKIMAHPQVLKQCEQTLKDKFEKYKLVSGEGNVVDTAKAAEELAKGRILKNTAILGPANLAERYGFDLIAEDLQD
ncbi:MAG: prephenate dehydrogenase/arogenate dehydrogenase family protein, partial [Candidatus Levyibacteriota bacterium]